MFEIRFDLLTSSVGRLNTSTLYMKESIFQIFLVVTDRLSLNASGGEGWGGLDSESTRSDCQGA